MKKLLAVIIAFSLTLAISLGINNLHKKTELANTSIKNPVLLLMQVMAVLMPEQSA